MAFPNDPGHIQITICRVELAIGPAIFLALRGPHLKLPIFRVPFVSRERSNGIAPNFSSPPNEEGLCFMATCAVCKTKETQLYENGVPICTGCVNWQQAKAKLDEIRRNVANAIDGNDGNDQPNLRIVPRYSK